MPRHRFCGNLRKSGFYPWHVRNSRRSCTRSGRRLVSPRHVHRSRGRRNLCRRRRHLELADPSPGADLNPSAAANSGRLLGIQRDCTHPFSQSSTHKSGTPARRFGHSDAPDGSAWRHSRRTTPPHGGDLGQTPVRILQPPTHILAPPWSPDPESTTTTWMNKPGVATQAPIGNTKQDIDGHIFVWVAHSKQLGRIDTRYGHIGLRLGLLRAYHAGREENSPHHPDRTMERSGWNTASPPAGRKHWGNPFRNEQQRLCRPAGSARIPPRLRIPTNPWPRASAPMSSASVQSLLAEVASATCPAGPRRWLQANQGIKPIEGYF